MTLTLKDHKSQVMDVVDDAIRKTFKIYFDLDVDVEKIRSFDFLKASITCKTTIHDSGLKGMVFISIEESMLEELARKVYPPQTVLNAETLESCALEITNIVCSRIKTYFNESGYNFDMDLPSVVKDKDIVDDDIEMIFSVKEERMIIDIGMLNQKAALV
jgi:CheY-specific phosphatase CheX